MRLLEDAFENPKVRDGESAVEPERERPCIAELNPVPAVAASCPPSVGQKVEGKGIFLCEWKPADEDGAIIGTFNVFAAPEDLPYTPIQEPPKSIFRKAQDFARSFEKLPKRKIQEMDGKTLMSYKETARQVAGLRDWHGHDGAFFEEERDLRSTLKNGNGIGKWFIPTQKLLLKLIDCKEEGAFKDTFPPASRELCLESFYWCSKPEEVKGVTYIWQASIHTGVGFYLDPERHCLNCRPCFAELVP
jgi:hypothetical protein